MKKDINVSVTVNCFYEGELPLDEMAFYVKGYSAEDYENAYDEEIIKENILDCLDDFLGERSLQDGEIQSFDIDVNRKVLSYDLVADAKLDLNLEIAPAMTVESYFEIIGNETASLLNTEEMKHFATGMTDIVVNGENFELDWNNEKEFARLKESLFKEKELNERE